MHGDLIPKKPAGEGTSGHRPCCWIARQVGSRPLVVRFGTTFGYIPLLRIRIVARIDIVACQGSRDIKSQPLPVR